MIETEVGSSNGAGKPAALILAAGRGSRLKEYTRDRPKCLLEVGERTIIEHQIQALKLAGISTIQVVTGYGADLVRAVCGDTVSYAHNEQFDSTNSFDSFGCTTLPPAPHGFLVLNSDVLFHPGLIHRLLTSPRENVLLADFEAGLAAEEMKIEVDGDSRIVAISKALDPAEAQAENLGVLRLGAPAAGAMLRLSRADTLSDARIAWLPDGIHHLRNEFPFYALSAEGFPWTEIDFVQDLMRARNEIYPLVHEALWGKAGSTVSRPVTPSP
jgi:choline kinase